jgi:hypothetical protein
VCDTKCKNEAKNRLKNNDLIFWLMLFWAPLEDNYLMRTRDSPIVPP